MNKKTSDIMPQLLVIWAVTPFILLLIWFISPAMFENNPYLYLLLFGMVLLTLNLYN